MTTLKDRKYPVGLLDTGTAKLFRFKQICKKLADQPQPLLNFSDERKAQRSMSLC